jgi:hypothetical protein
MRILLKIIIFSPVLFILTACSSQVQIENQSHVQIEEQIEFLMPYTDARIYIESPLTEHQADTFNPNDIATFMFTSDTIFRGSEDIAASVLEAGKNPGLGVRNLHRQGITGAGVRVAIIDQNLALTHPEYVDSIVEYKDFETGLPPEIGSMHGPAIASLLVGKECGTAPGALLYYAATPGWHRDNQYEANALYWIINENENLPEGDKIRVVSVSGPSMSWDPQTTNRDMYNQAVEDAMAAGIMVLDGRNNLETGFLRMGGYDLNEPDNFSLLTPQHLSESFPGYQQTGTGLLFVPTNRRTMAEEYEANLHSFLYTGQGGLSWSMPYVSGVLAMGWQVNPGLGNDEILRILFETAYVDTEGYQYVNPPAFIEAIKQQLD